jgi:hypothetical protein
MLEERFGLPDGIQNILNIIQKLVAHTGTTSFEIR